MVRRCSPSIGSAPRRSPEPTMPNPGQPTIRLGATGKVVRRLQRALRRTPNPTLPVDGVFSPQLEAVVKDFQEGAGNRTAGSVEPFFRTGSAMACSPLRLAQPARCYQAGS